MKVERGSGKGRGVDREGEGEGGREGGKGSGGERDGEINDITNSVVYVSGEGGCGSWLGVE